MRIQMKITDMEQLKVQIQKDAEEELQEIAERIQSNAVNTLMTAGTTDTGLLARSIEITPATLYRSVEVTAPYGIYIEYGTDPHYIPPNVLYGWCRRKLGLNDEEARSASFAIANKIAKVGTEPQPFWNSAITEAVEWFKRRIEHR